MADRARPPTLAIVTGALAPYTVRLYDAFAARHDVRLNVFVCEKIEPQRQWTLKTPTHFSVEVLPGLRRHVSYTRHVYFNPAVVTALGRLRPEAILVEDFSPTMAVAALTARARRIPYGLKTDGHRGIDPGETSRVHAAMRRLIVPGARFAVCASEDSVAFLEHWGLVQGRGTVVPIVVPWDPPQRVPGYHDRPFDLLFAGAINEHIKGARFIADVIARVAAARPGLRVRFAGDGPLRAELAERFSKAGIAAHFDGALQAEQMPDVFMSAKLLLFASRGDAWGLVANEAAMCGTPVLGSPHAVSSRRLVEACGIGETRALDVAAWAETATAMISDADRWHRYADNRDDVCRRFGINRSVTALAESFARVVDIRPRSDVGGGPCG